MKEFTYRRDVPTADLTRDEKRAKVAEYIAENPHITYARMAALLHTSISTLVSITKEYGIQRRHQWSPVFTPPTLGKPMGIYMGKEDSSLSKRNGMSELCMSTEEMADALDLQELTDLPELTELTDAEEL